MSTTVDPDARHVHTWVPAGAAYACTGCTETTDPCVTCARPLPGALAICDPCLVSARKIITDTRDAIATVPFHIADIMGLHAVRYDRVLVASSSNPDRLPFGLDLIVEDPEDPRLIRAAKHPDTAVDALTRWADAWAETRGETVTDTYTFLYTHTLWAAQNPDLSGWHTYLDEAHQVRNTVRRLLGLTPIARPAPCVHCGGRIVQDWTNQGLDDVHTCTRCGTTWGDRAHLHFTTTATIHGLPETHPDTLVTLEQAKDTFPHLRRNLIALWANRDTTRPDNEKRMPVRGHTTTGLVLYRLGDIAAQVNTDTNERKVG